MNSTVDGLRVLVVADDPLARAGLGLCWLTTPDASLWGRSVGKPTCQI